ncbi:TPA: hypothetical protein ACL4JF_001532, partial [Streptococcus pneumoniae]
IALNIKKERTKFVLSRAYLFFNPLQLTKSHFLSKCKSLGTIIQFILFSKCSRFNPSYSF